MRPFLSPEASKALQTVNHSGQLIVNLYNQGVKKFYQGLELTGRHAPMVALVHVGFVDVAYHMFWDSMDSELMYLESNPKVDRTYHYVIEGMHRLLDLMLGDLIAEMDLNRDAVLIFSDHGATGGFAKTYYGHEPTGFMVIAGAGVRPGTILDARAQMVDVVPTVCRWLGVGPPPKYPGQALDKVFEPADGSGGKRR